MSIPVQIVLADARANNPALLCSEEQERAYAEAALAASVAVGLDGDNEPAARQMIGAALLGYAYHGPAAAAEESGEEARKIGFGAPGLAKVAAFVEELRRLPDWRVA